MVSTARSIQRVFHADILPACSFYGLDIILLPYNLPHPKIFELLNQVGAEALIAAAGNVPLQDLEKECQQLESVTWVVEKTSRHMDWNEQPRTLRVSVWHDLVEENASESSSLPTNEDSPNMTLGTITTIWQAAGDSKNSIATFTQANLASAVGAMITVLPLRQRLGPSDLVLPVDSFAHSYVLCYTLAALFSHASLAITSVAGPSVDFAQASRSVAPTVIIAPSETLVEVNKASAALSSGVLKGIARYSQAQALAAGHMPTSGLLTSITSSPTPGKLRLILASHRLGLTPSTLEATTLTALRISTGARIAYALTTANVAGAVTQTNPFDYRADDEHFGPPLASVEIRLANQSDAEVSGSVVKGNIVVSGPAVAEGEVDTGIQGVFRADCCLGLS